MELPIKAASNSLGGIFNLINTFPNIFNTILDYINPFSDNFILKTIINNFSTILDYLNPFSNNFILKTIINYIGTLLDYINPFSNNFFGYKVTDLIHDLLDYLFIPTDDSNFSRFSNKLNTKFAFVSQIKDLFNSVLGYNNYGEDVPSFSITYNGLTFTIIDFSIFLNYRSFIHGIILAISWFNFTRRTFNKLPSIIGGFGDDN